MSTESPNVDGPQPTSRVWSRGAKVSAGGLGGAAFGVWAARNVAFDGGEFDPLLGLATVAIAAGGGATLGLLLDMRTRFRERVSAPDAPPPERIARLLFGGGSLSLFLVWLPILFVLGIAAIVVWAMLFL